MELPAIEIAEREMRKIEVLHIPVRLRIFRGLAAESFAEKSQLKPKMPAFGGAHVAGVVPPFGLKVGMVEMVARKFIAISGQRGLIVGGQQIDGQQSHPQTCAVNPHESPRWDSDAWRCGPDTIPQAPWTHRRARSRSPER